MFKKKTKKLINTTPIFVIGTGRSGTHLLGRTFLSNKDCKVLIEDPMFFKDVTKIATGQRKRRHFKKVLKNYRNLFVSTKEKYVLEKTHPNIWFVEDLLEAFPNAKFIGIKRDPYATISSMLNHGNVMKWYNVLPLNKENDFLGIDSENINYFTNLSIEAKAAFRWKSHIRRLNYLEEIFPNNVMVFDYEDYFNNNEELMNKISSFIGISGELHAEKIKNESLDKWKTHLTSENIENINNVIK